MANLIELVRTIDPRIDYVFKVLFATEGNEIIVIGFLNAILKPPVPIKAVEIGNPFNEREFSDQKMTVVDVKVKDKKGYTYQIEMQLGNHKDIKKRSLVNWSQIYSKQVNKGDAFDDIKPTISIWLLTQNITEKPSFHNVVELTYRGDHDLYIDHLEIHLLELKKWHMPDEPTLEDLWTFLLSKPHTRFDLPQLFNEPSMRRAMEQIKQISEKEEKWYRYHSRMMYEKDQAAIRQEREQLERDNLQLGQENQQLGQENQQLGQENQQLGQEVLQAQKDRDTERELRLKAEQEKAAQIEQYRLKQLDNAKKLIALNTLSVEQIADMTQLPIDDIQALVDKR